MKIAVTLVLPAYNEEPNIERAINDARPMLEYMSDDWEIVVVDDGSRDKTADIVKHMAKHNCRIRLVQHAKNKGYGQALITGFYS
ncbi:MAG: glycosyltransferase family 2 protein, partial [Candidatus Omnitrophica bacterium]|nr:glycosyltransferase family 2 protein [Candidatus Omnitrophota bacterium]